MTASAYDDGDHHMARRRKKRDPVPALPRRVLVRVGNRIVAEVSFGDDPGLIVPGSLAWHADPAGVPGPDRERAVARLVREAGLDPKCDHERLYEAVFGGAPPYKGT